MVTGIYTRRRTLALLSIFGIIFFGLIGRMGYLQIVDGNWLQEQSFRYRMRPTPIQPDRGEIRDRNGQPLLKNVVCESIFAQPILLQNKPEAARAIAPILGMKPEDVETKMNRPTYSEWLSRKVKPEVVNQVKALNIKGIGYAPEKCRQYVEDDLAIHVLGISNLDHHGIEGLELYYDKYLSGTPGAIQCEYTARGLPMDGGDCRVMMGEPGLNLQTTLDIGLQRMLQRSVERAHLETKAKRATIMVMQVRTGEILGLAQWPTYDPLLGGNSEPALRRAFPVVDALNPGSIFKPVTASAALQTGVINQNSTINDTGCMTVNGWSICNWDHKALGSVKIDKVMAASSNVGFGTLGMMLGRDRFYDYLDKFGFTRRTGIDLPGEAVGQWIPKGQASEIDLATQAFGQTLTVTPIQMLTAIGAIANDGQLMWPHLAKALTDRDGNVVEHFDPKVVRQAVSPEVARYVQQLMVGVVDNGTGRNARVPGYKVGGKTGTANKVVGGKVSRDLHIASFVGFAPYPNPEIVTLISLDEPQGAYYGGQIAAPIYGELMGEILDYFNAPPSKEPPPKPSSPWEPGPPKPPQEAVVPSLVNLPIPVALRAAEQAGFAVRFEGDGQYVTQQFPPAGTSAYKGGQILAKLDPPAPSPEKVRVPWLIGKSLPDAAQALAEKGLLIEAEGTGKVVAQDPPAGTLVPKWTPVKLRFAPDSKP